MARNDSRSMNGNLYEGLTDGKYKKMFPDRGGEVETTSFQDRKDLADIWHGMHETAEKALPDGRRRVTPNYIEN